MYLKRLELYGFKTFSRKTEIEFPHGFLAVVGPNGSGKSNLTDAIRFCLGESNVKALRATRLEELVFAGTPTRNPAPFAEVTAVFDNSDHKLPLDLSEVAITRRLDRDGGSKFQINRTNCRLKDVHELLMGSGIGPGSFSVLGGKEVDRVLSSDPKDRRLMLEETAGVNRYKFRKKEAHRRLARTEDNLTRLRDILKEVEAQLAESKRQLQRYERYKKGQEELKKLDRQVARHELDGLEREKAELEARLAELTQQHTQAQERENELRNKLQSLRQKKAEIDLDKESRAQQLANLREQAGAARAAHEGLFQRASELEHQAKAALTRLESGDQRIEAQDQRLTELADQRPALENDLALADKAVDELVAELSALPAPGQGPHAEIKFELNRAEKNHHRLESDKARLSARQENDQSRLDELETQTTQLDQESELVSPAALPIEDLSQKAQLAEQSVAHHRQQLSDLGEKRKELSQQRQELEKKRRPTIGRVSELEALTEDRSGLPPAVRQVMQWKKEGVVGLVGELIRVPEGLEQAYEAALGGHLNDVIARDRKVASELIARLKQERIGRVTFWPLDLSRRASRPPELPDRRGVVGRALELLGYPREIETVLQEILGKTVIMEDMPLALALYDRCFGRRPHLVTREGDYLSPSGALTGGRRRHSKAGMLARRRQLEQARQELLDLDNALIALNHQEEQFAGQLAQAQEQLQAAQEIHQGRRQELQDALAEQKRRESDQQRLEDRRARLQTEKARLVERLENSRLELESLTEQQAELTQTIAKLQTDYEHHLENENQLNKIRDGLNQKIMEARLVTQQARQNIQELEKELRREKQRREELKSDQQQAETEHRRCLETRAKLELEGNQLQARLEQLEQELEQRNQDLQALRQATAGVDRDTREAAERFERASATVQKWAGRISHLQVDQARVLAHYEEAVERLEQYGEPDPDEAPLESDQLKSARKRIQRLKSFLENFGGVNLGAREDHDRLSERFEHLNTQITDLTEGARSLRKTMAELDKATTTQFEKTFHQVNNTFSRLFSDLFGGGQARLELADPSDPLDSGVEIVACPPGKRLQNMTLMSSGERALCAIAFLMSLLAHKPSPVVILDELDAPLDERNVEKVATRLTEFSSSSQFLVITHNRKTMEFADRLYGVTMIEPGTSKILSVELATVEQELGAPLG